MDKEKIQQKMQELIEIIEKHNFLYYQKASPIISDSEYDGLLEQLKNLEKQYPELVLPFSPTFRVGNDLDNRFAEMKHEIPVLSLDKVYSEKELLEWITKAENLVQKKPLITLEPKIDGFSVILYYKKGILQYAVSRGNGLVGNDLTENVKTIKKLPLKIQEPIDIALRGEIFIHKHDFQEYNAKMGNIYANPRNFAAGSIRRIKSKEVAQIPLDIFVYDGFSKQLPITESFSMYQWMQNNHFPTNPIFFVFGPQKEENILPYSEISNKINEIKELRKKLSYEIDGLVFKINDFALREEMGYTAHHPRWAMAYKFEAPQTISRVLDITLQIGRTGKVTPLASLEPVVISGSTVSKATLHNPDYIRQLELSIGDLVAVSKRGEIIPAIEKVIEKSENPLYTFPSDCPECHSPLYQKGPNLFCPNKKCPARIRERITFFVQTLEIENIGKETIRFLLEKNYIQSIEDLINFDFQLLLKEEGFGVKKIALMQKGIEQAKKQPFEKLVVALGLEEIGPKVVEILKENGITSFMHYREIAQKNDKQRLLSFHGIGESTALAFLEHFKDPETLALIDFLEKKGFPSGIEQEDSHKIKISDKLANTVWCVTGVFEHFKPREKALEWIIANGGKVSENITSQTTHLLAGKNAGSKLEKARARNITIVSEEEFLAMQENKKQENKKQMDSLF